MNLRSREPEPSRQQACLGIIHPPSMTVGCGQGHKVLSLTGPGGFAFSDVRSCLSWMAPLMLPFDDVL